MLENLAIVLVLVGLSYLILFRRHGPQPDSGPMKSAAHDAATARPQGNPETGPAAAPPMSVHAVSIVPGREPCAAARACRDERFLSLEAPSLPLTECDRARCECRYQHHDDRRTGDDRREIYTAASRIGAVVDDERRLAEDRRRS